MSQCDRARALFGPFWDDEISRAERDWLDHHFAGCAPCRGEYDEYSRALELVSTLPRAEASPELLGRVLARTRHAAPAPDLIRVPRAANVRRWVPVAAAAGLLVVLGSVLTPLLMTRQHSQAPTLATRNETPGGAEPVAITAPTIEPARNMGDAPRETPRQARGPAAEDALASAVADSLFDHSEDVEFVLDPVMLRRGRAHKSSRLAQSQQGDQAIISF